MGEAGRIAGLSPVPVAARGVRGRSRREGVEWACADLMLGGGRCMLSVRFSSRHHIHTAPSNPGTHHIPLSAGIAHEQVPVMCAVLAVDASRARALLNLL